MRTGIIIVPKTSLYESITTEHSCTYGQNISDELLSGWTVTIEKDCGKFLKVTTCYGYSGWLEASAVQDISPEQSGYWNDRTQTALICRGIIDILKEPRVQSKVLSTLFMGSTVIPMESPKDGWQKIKTADNTCGYLPCIALLYPMDENYTQQELRSAILHYAVSFLGTQYRWGGKTQEGIDCSGLTFMSYYMCGILIYRDAAIKEGYPVHEIPISRIKPADLLYFPGHIALYLGDGKYIHSTGNLKSFGCVINSLNPEDADYRADLAKSLKAVGSVFDSKQEGSADDIYLNILFKRHPQEFPA